MFVYELSSCGFESNFNHIAELTIPTEILTNETKVEIETQPVTAETTITNVQCNLKTCKLLYASY